MKTITATRLVLAHACEDGLLDFCTAFPEGLEVSEAGLAQAKNAGLDIEWARCLLPEETAAAYSDFCLAQYDKLQASCQQFDELYEKICTEAEKRCRAIFEDNPDKDNVEQAGARDKAYVEYNAIRERAAQDNNNDAAGPYGKRYTQILEQELLRLLQEAP